ncbi:hypothetical protein TVNIR_2731 [Thioalkalivibrio nitratireducens DSM 14787]|uniref:Uncharacterized protein n=1 Tax=Thioalkalivibrio nitratireducens (strain DSM 14787 / UNIQEM 213 / ALEN2) TaxID=1255043 RepID=L0DZA8_THIND|nr:hypothetical protein TVNIR_2731 [Thioalkalivibrio nitratireducens DSM 14787]
MQHCDSAKRENSAKRPMIPRASSDRHSGPALVSVGRIDPPPDHDAAPVHQG